MGGLKINKAYLPLFTSDKRYYLLTGGRASLKSTTIHDFASRLTYEDGHGILVTRYTMSSAAKSIIPEFENVIKRNDSYNDFEKVGSKYTNRRTGSFILFSGIKTSSGDQTAALKSLAGITTWIIDEGEDFTDEVTFDDIDDSIRGSTRQNRIVWVQNPSTKEHFIYKRFVENHKKYIDVEGHQVAISNHPKVEAIHTTYHIAERAGYLSQDWLEKVNQTKIDNPKRYYHKYLGGWLEKAEGVVFDNWEVGEFNPDNMQVIYGQDYGFSTDPTTLIAAAIDNKRKVIFVKELLYKPKMTTNEIAEFNLNNAAKSLIVGDSAEPRLIQELNNKGCNMQPSIKGQGSITAGVEILRSYKLIIDADSKNLIKELNNYSYADKGAKVYIDDHNHAIDALRYAVYYKMNKKGYGKYTVI